MKTALLIASGLCLAMLATVGAPGPAQALTMKECSAKYKEAKTAGTLNGMKWNDFRKAQCGAEAAAEPGRTAARRGSAAACTHRRRAGGQAGGEGVARPSGDVRARARLRQRVEGRQGGRQNPGRTEVAAILAPVRRAQEGAGDVR